MLTWFSHQPKIIGSVRLFPPGGNNCGIIFFYFLPSYEKKFF
ncbi:hypothetical protein AAJ76_2260001509 [Vairimorpha ceranae]|uniref:Uncharacterized protein n=1 Tax=Vairimorpha ceranae TaxID=40302 RepID=A0A0F9WL22_9MICR|nr:hypothetical protein AAJ76_2260001509 [Vairimorpha ceranae]KKO73803.1 hypothetical protein AAJ76_2260001509 [Vairimorpha ceranae]